jgi:hypothetical protein
VRFAKGFCEPYRHCRNRILSALPAADISDMGVLGMADTLSLVCGMMEVL